MMDDPSSSSSSPNSEKKDESIAEEEWQTSFLSSLAPLFDSDDDFSDEDAEQESGIKLVRAAMDGNLEIFHNPNLSNKQFLRKTCEENNILHIAIRYEQIEFVRALLKYYYGKNNKEVLSDANSQGNTPLHVAAEVGNKDIVEVLYYYLEKSFNEGEEEKKPWRARNSEGNTALHLALLSHNCSVAEYLVKKDGGLASIVNHSLEAPLHLAITHLDNNVIKDMECMVSVLLEEARSVPSWRDTNGLTPLLRAAASLGPKDIVPVTNEMIDVCPESTLVCDASGNSFLHHLVRNNKLFGVSQDQQLEREIRMLIRRKEICILKNNKDKDGNTPSHIAAQCNNNRLMRFLVVQCSVNRNIRNSDGISAVSIIEQRDLFNQPRSIRPEEVIFANKGDVDSLRQSWRFAPSDFQCSHDDATGSNFLHLLMNTTAIHHVFSSSEDHSQFIAFIRSFLLFHGHLACEVDKSGDTPVHILVRNKDFRKSMENPPTTSSLWESGILSQLLSICADAKINVDLKVVPPWGKQNEKGNTPLHEAILANNKVLVLQLLTYSQESAHLVNKNKETPLHLLAGIAIRKEEYTDEDIMKMVNANIEALRLPDKDGLTPISRAVKVENLQIVVTLLHSAKKLGDTDCQNSCLPILDHPSSDFFNGLLQFEAFRNLLHQKDKIGDTLLHLAIKENCFVFVQVLLKHEAFKGIYSKELIKLLSMSNNIGETPEDLLADLKNIEKELEKTLLNDPRMKGIRSSWGIPRTQLQNYMSSMNVIAALQTTITFTAAFTVPGGLNQDKGTPLLIQDISFQVFMISDVIAMCLSMMVLICLLWMVATNKRKSVMIQDFALTLLLLSFVATILTFMAGVYATIYPVKPWIAITSLVLCSLVMLFFPRRVLTELLLHFKCPTVQSIKKVLMRSANSSNTPEQRSVLDV